MRRGVGADDIFMAERAGPGEPWRNVQPVANVNSPDDQGGVFITDDGLALYFYREPSDVWVATRPSGDADFGPPQPVPELSTDYIEWHYFMTPDGQTVVFVRQLDLAGSNMDVFIADRI